MLRLKIMFSCVMHPKSASTDPPHILSTVPVLIESAGCPIRTRIAGFLHVPSTGPLPQERGHDRLQLLADRIGRHQCQTPLG